MSKTVLIMGNHDIVIFNFRKELIISLLKKGYRVKLCFPKGKHTQYFINLGCEFIDIELNRHGTNPFADFKLYKTYKMILKKHNPDIILSYTIKPNIYASIAAKKLNIPNIMTITGIGNGFIKDNIVQKVIKKLYKVATKETDKVFFQNKDNMEVFLDFSLVREEQVKLVNGSGVNVNEYPLMNINYDEKKITFIGRIMKEKGIVEFLKAAEIVKNSLNEYQNVTFDIYGMPEDDTVDIVQEFVRKKIVTYHGLVDDMKTVYRESYCIVLPSYHEGLSNVLLEAASSGRICIASDIPGCKETILNKKTGYLVPKKDPMVLAQSILHVINLSENEVEKMSILATEYVNKNFNRVDVVNEYINEIEKLL